VRVISVEAQSEFVYQIYDNASRNGARDRVDVEFGLIGAGAGAFSDASILHSASHFGAEPPDLTMPDVMRRHGLNHIDFLKVDIEGSEFGLSEGGSEWLTSVDMMAMEVHRERHVYTLLLPSGDRESGRLSVRPAVSLPGYGLLIRRQSVSRRISRMEEHPHERSSVSSTPHRSMKVVDHASPTRSLLLRIAAWVVLTWGSSTR